MNKQSKNSFNVIIQPIALWAKQMKWETYDSHVNVITMDYGITVGGDNSTKFVKDLMMAFRNYGETMVLVVYDRWDILGQQLLTAKFTQLHGQTYYTANPSSDVLLSWIGVDELYLLSIYGRTYSEDDLHIVANDLLLENVGMHLPGSVNSILYAGHDNTYLGLITRFGNKSVLSKIMKICKIFNIELNVM